MVAAALDVCHLAEDAAVRGGDAFNRAEGAVDIPGLVHGDVALGIAVLGRDLSVLEEPVDPFLRCDEAPFSVRSRCDVHAAQVRFRKPRRAVAHDLGIDHGRNMPADGVEGQGRRILVLAGDLSARHKAELDQRLEAVADTECQTVAVFQKVGDRLADGLVAEGRREEFGRAVRLVTAGEAAREHDDLRIADRLFKNMHGLADILRAQVREHLRDRLRAGCLKGRSGIILTVRAGEDRDKDGRLRNLVRADINIFAVLLHVVEAGRNFRRIVGSLCREDLLQRLRPRADRLFDRHFLSSVGEHGAVGVACALGSPGHHADAAVVVDLQLLEQVGLSALHLEDQVADAVFKELTQVKLIVEAHAEPVAEGHLCDGRGDAVGIHRISGCHGAGAHKLRHFLIEFQNIRIIRDVVLVFVDPDLHQDIALFLQLGRDHVILRGDVHRKGNQGRRDINVVEGTGHGVLAADTRDLITDLRVVCAQQCGKRLAPALRILRHSAEVLLEGKVQVLIITAGGDNFRDGLCHRVDRAVVRAPVGQIRVKAIAHHGDGVCLSAQNRELGDHGLRLGKLILSAVRHVHRARADGGVKHLHQALLRADVQILQGCEERIAEELGFRLILILFLGVLGGLLRQGNQRVNLLGGELLEIVVIHGRDVHFHVRLLMRAVGVEEASRQINDRFAPPLQDQSRRLSDHCHLRRLEVFFFCIGKELFRVLRRNHDSHALLGFGDRQLCSVKAFILLRHQIHVDFQACCQLADGDGDAARAEVVALFDQLRDLRTSEKSLQFALRGRIALLDLRAAGLQRSGVVRFGGTGCAAAAVTSRAPAEQNNDIAGVRGQTHDIITRRGAHYRADLHSFGHIIRMIKLLDLAGRKTDLVAVARIAGGRAAHQLLLGQLALHGL